MATAHSMVLYRPIDEFPGYATSDEGQRVWSRWKHNGRKRATIDGEWHELKPCHNGRGYCAVNLYKNRKKYNLKVHRLVATEKYGPIPKGMKVRHLDGNKLNNHPSNILLGTRTENVADRKKPGHDNYVNAPRGERHSSAKLTWKQVRQIRALYATGKWAQRSLADKFGVSLALVSKIVRGEIWRHLL